MSGVILGRDFDMFRICFGYVLDMFWTFFWTGFGHVLDKSWAIFGPYSGQVLLPKCCLIISVNRRSQKYQEATTQSKLISSHCDALRQNLAVQLLSSEQRSEEAIRAVEISHGPAMVQNRAAGQWEIGRRASGEYRKIIENHLKSHSKT